MDIGTRQGFIKAGGLVLIGIALIVIAGGTEAGADGLRPVGAALLAAGVVWWLAGVIKTRRNDHRSTE